MNKKLYLAATFAIACLTAPAQTSVNSKARLDQFTKLPDWSGIWRLVGSPAILDREDAKSFISGTRDNPPFKPEFEARYKADLVRAEHQGDAKFPNPLVDTHTVFCAAGMPHMMGAPFDYEFIITPEKVWMIADRDVRHIYTDGRKLPPEDELWPMLVGRSIGHWEGQTLVIETVSLRDDIWADTTPVYLSKQARIVERIRQTDANTLENQMTIQDPVKFTKPWAFTKRFKKQDPKGWMPEAETCGGPEDRNPIVNGRVTNVLPKQK